MKNSEELPEELKCFICLKMVSEYKTIGVPIHCKDSIVIAGFAVCNDDFAWVVQNPEAATAICQSRIEGAIKENES